MKLRKAWGSNPFVPKVTGGNWAVGQGAPIAKRVAGRILKVAAVICKNAVLSAIRILLSVIPSQVVSKKHAGRGYNE